MVLNFGGENSNLQNNSGQGPNVQVPDVVAKKFNWGAFLLSWIWGIGNKTWITFLVWPACFVPFVGGLICLGLQIWFGIKGNEWAWQNKKFESVEAFHKNQKTWAIVGTILAVIGIILGAIGLFVTFSAMNSIGNYQ